MKKLLLALVFLSGCSGGEGGEESANVSSQAQRPAPAGKLATLIGLYEGGDVGPPNQMCIVGEEEDARFGLVVWGADLHSCSGSGTVQREGDTLRLRMAGDETCVIDATISGTTVILPRSVPEGCAYYCGARATLTGAELTQKGTTEADARKAEDLVGDPLCLGG